jgi:hypothetical protein
MSAFRRAFGIACFVYAAFVILRFFKLISFDANLMVAGFLVLTAVSLAIDAIVARQEKKGVKAKDV